MTSLAPADLGFGAESTSPATSDAPSGPSAKTFRPDIEGLRAIAVLLVVLFHAGVTLFRGAYIGVDVFFVISGFLITGLLLDEYRRAGRISIPNFYARRTRRLLPLSTLVIASTLLGSYLIMPTVALASVGKAAMAAALYCSNIFFANSAGDYLAGDINGNPILQYWSLGVEEQFYIFWPLLIMLAAWGGPRAARGISYVVRRVALLLAGLGVTSFVLSVVITSTNASAAYFGLHTRAWELAAGAGLAIARPRLGSIPRRVAVVAGVLGLGLVLASAVTLTQRSAFPGWLAAIPVLGTVLLLATGVASGKAGVGAFLTIAPMRYIGRISYAWYLWHWPVLVLTGVALGGIGGKISSLHWWQAAAAVIASFVFAAVTSALIEAPVRESKVLKASVRKSLMLGATLTAVGALIAVPMATSGVAAGHVTRADDPTKAVADRFLDDACNVSIGPVSAPPAAKCLTGDPNGTKTVVVLGDSHAAQWLDSLTVAARAQHWKLYTYTKSRCPVNGVHTWLPNANSRYTACEKWNASVWSNLKAVGPIDLIIDARYWAYNDTVLTASGKRATGTLAAALWQQAAGPTFQRLATRAAHIVVLRDTPYPGFDVPTCLSSRSAAACSFPRSPGIGRDRYLYAGEKAASNPHVAFVDMSNAICGRTPRCPVISPDGLIHYRDTNHLTVSYARTLAPELARKIALIIGAATPPPTPGPSPSPSVTPTATPSATAATSARR